MFSGLLPQLLTELILVLLHVLTLVAIVFYEGFGTALPVEIALTLYALRIGKRT